MTDLTRLFASRLLSLATASTAVMISLPAMSQSDEDAPQDTPQDTIEEIIVTADPVGLREGQESATLFGLGRALIDTPRSISVVSATTMQRYAIEDTSDFISTTPGNFGGRFFGVPGAISIRGDIGDNYFRGFKRVVNNGLFPTPIGASDRVEIVRGPAPAIYGAARIGGFLNFHPKTTNAAGLSAADGASGNISVTGGSYGKFNVAAQIDLPFLAAGRESGLSVYGEYEDSKHFFRGREPEHQLLQAAFTHDLPGRARFEMGGMYFHSEGYFQTPGWNRVTQDLIDNGIYITGRDTDLVDTDGNGRLTPADIDAVVGTFVGTSNIRKLIDVGVVSIPAAYGLDTGVGTGELDRRTVFLAPGEEIQDADNFTLYLDLEKDFGESTVKFQLFYDDLKGILSQSTGFAAEHITSAFEARLSYETKINLSGAMGIDIYATASRRSYKSDLGEEFLSSYLGIDRRDRLWGPTGTDIFGTPVTVEAGGIGWDSNFESNWVDTGVALVADIHLIDNLGILLNGRYDNYKANSIDTGATVFDPTLANTLFKSKEGDFSYSASVSYSLNGQVVPYFTYAQGSSIQQNSNGGVSPGRVRDGSILAGSELLEAGVKFSLLDNSLNGSIAYYKQERTVSDPFGNVDIEKGKGLEIELRYIVTENWSLTSAATFQEFTISPPGACGGGRGEFVVIPPTAIPAGALQFGLPLPTSQEGFGGIFAALNASCLPELQNGYERKSIPDTVVSIFATYTSDLFDWGLFGATFGGTHVSKTGGKITNAIVLPSYILFRAAAFAEFKEFSLTATIDNVFDQRYFIPLQGVYEEVAVLPGIGRTFRITAKASF